MDQSADNVNDRGGMTDDQTWHGWQMKRRGIDARWQMTWHGITPDDSSLSLICPGSCRDSIRCTQSGYAGNRHWRKFRLDHLTFKLMVSNCWAQLTFSLVACVTMCSPCVYFPQIFLYILTPCLPSHIGCNWYRRFLGQRAQPLLYSPCCYVIRFGLVIAWSGLTLSPRLTLGSSAVGKPADEGLCYTCPVSLTIVQLQA